jgi:L-asparaginase
MKKGNNNKVLVITTGGTIDKRYNALTGDLYFEGTIVEGIIRQANIYAYEIEIVSPMQLDSLDMLPKHRRIIADLCENRPEKLIVVLHGTDTMVESAKVVGELGLDKTIVFTGAMFPYEMRESDAATNVISALSVVQVMASGTFISMGGAVFPYDNVTKDTSIGKFVELNPGKFRSFQRFMRKKSIEIWEMLTN